MELIEILNKITITCCIIALGCMLVAYGCREGTPKDKYLYVWGFTLYGSISIGLVSSLITVWVK